MKTKCRFSFYSRTFGLLPDEITILVLNQPILNLRPKHPNSTLYVPHHLADVMTDTDHIYTTSNSSRKHDCLSLTDPDATNINIMAVELRSPAKVSPHHIFNKGAITGTPFIQAHPHHIRAAD